MPTEESMLQVCSIWLLKMCIGSIVPELETSSCFVFFLRGNYLNRYAAILSKGSLDFFIFQLYTISFIPNLGIKGCRSIWAKKISA
jgi:hypothetical protein